MCHSVSSAVQETHIFILLNKYMSDLKPLLGCWILSWGLSSVGLRSGPRMLGIPQNTGEVLLVISDQNILVSAEILAIIWGCQALGFCCFGTTLMACVFLPRWSSAVRVPSLGCGSSPLCLSLSPLRPADFFSLQKGLEMAPFLWLPLQGPPFSAYFLLGT